MLVHFKCLKFSYKQGVVMEWKLIKIRQIIIILDIIFLQNFHMFDLFITPCKPVLWVLVGSFLISF